VWFPHAIPKHAFILWLAMQDRLLIGDHLIKWGYKGEVKCLFCHNQMESMEHLFLNVVSVIEFESFVCIIVK
jgi:hypothetical protein